MPATLNPIRRLTRAKQLTPLAIATFIVAAACAAIALLNSAPPASADVQTSKEKSSPEVVPAPPAAPRDKLAEPRYIGAGSCAARACHGSPTLTPGREWNSAYAVWISSDPHAQAYAVLFTPESRRMGAVLSVGDPSKANRCLACHSAPLAGSRATAAVGDAASIMADGVSCEVCHGPAEKYLAAHTMRGWDQLGAARFENKFGMKNTADIAARAQVCVGCHVGQPDSEGKPWRDVNHDLIAAGHPRLNFDYAAFIATLPPHWNTQKNPQKFEELHSWLIGQFAASEQALKVLQARAKVAKSQSESQSPAANDSANQPIVNPSWPELSEYDCFACHHGLSGASWRQNAAQAAANPQDDRPPRKPGTPAWGTWYFTGPRLLAGTSLLIPDSQAADFRQRLNELTKSMQSPRQDADRVAQAASETATQLENCRPSALAHANRPADSAALRREIIQSLAAQFRQHKPESWDEFVQYYLALVALYKSEIDVKPQESVANAAQSNKQQLINLLEAIRNRLSFSSDLQVNTAEISSGGSSKLSPI
jgi:hypothetical protein